MMTRDKRITARDITSRQAVDRVMTKEGGNDRMSEIRHGYGSTEEE